MKVIGTAGHIDHGKSTLVTRLTGIDPDRLVEEKRRGMTIDLGFAWLMLPSGTTVSVVDVPGHERFVKNMLAGAAGIDVALLVVAADEGVMPQTREHLDILDLLQVRHGVIAITKADLVDLDWLQLVQEDVSATLKGTSLERQVVVPVSATTGLGIPALLAALDEAIWSGPPPRDRGRPFVPIDRVFSLPGFGTIVTGTLHDGVLEETDEVEVGGRRRAVRIRRIQTHGRHVARAAPGSRVAINLLGVARDEVERGDVLARPGAVVTTTRFDAQIRVLDSSAVALRHGMTVFVHAGAEERAAAVTVLGAAQIDPGESGWVQLRLHPPVAITRDQSVILRLPSPARTIAGGTIADVSPRHRRSDPAVIPALRALLSPLPDVALRAALEGDRPRTAMEIAFRAGLAEGETHSTLARLVHEGHIRQLGNHYLLTTRWSELTRRLEAVLREYHATNPLAHGMPKEELRSKLRWRFGAWQDVLRALAQAGVLRDGGASVSLPDHQGGTARRREAADIVLGRLRETPYSPPHGALLLVGTQGDPSLLRAMVVEGEIVQVDSDLYFDRTVYDEMVRRIVGAIKQDGAVTVAKVRDLFGTSRKYALALLEHLDDERVTRRQGDNRLLGNKAPSPV